MINLLKTKEGIYANKLNAVNAEKSAKGITLIALVITIIVLLILAGVSIAMLTGQNGILSRAQDTKGTNAYATACEQARLAYMSVKTEIMMQKVKNSSYNAQNDSQRYVTMIGNEVKGTGWSTPTYNSTSKEIEITYTNSSLREGMVETGKPAQAGEVNFKIGLLEQDATLSIDGVEVAGGSSSTSVNTGGVAKATRASLTPAPSGVTYTAGTEVTLGGEQFFVLSDDGTTVKLLAKYCLNKAGTAQVEEMVTSTNSQRNFSKTNYWSSDFTSSPFDLQTSAMITKAETDGNVAEEIPNAVLAAQSYGTGKGGSGRLMNYDEANSIASGSDITMKKILYGKWSLEGGMYFWLGDAADGTNVWCVDPDRFEVSGDKSYNGSYAAIRPVVIVTES